MANLLDAILSFFDENKNRTEEQKAANAIAVIQGARDASQLIALWSVLPPGLKEVPTVIQAYTQAEARVEAEGGLGPFGEIPKALFDGFSGLSGEIEKAIAESLKKNLVPGSPDAKHEFDGVLDVLMDGMLEAFRVQGKDVPKDVKESLRSAVLPVISLGLTFFVATSLAELIHPTKEMGWSNVSHFLYEMFGYKALTEAYIMPMRQALIEYPVRNALNTALQPYPPGIGDANGMARKHEISEDQYRSILRGNGIQEEYIDANLRAFWSDPRLFEILRILDVAMPDPTPPSDAVEWLTRAGMDSYIGPDWWLAMKFAKAGYDSLDIPVLIKVAKRRYLQSELGNIRTTQRKQFKNGQISRAKYEASLTERGVSLDDAKELLDAIEAERGTDITDDLQRLYELKYAYNRMTESELTAAFSTLNLDADYIAARVEYLKTKRLGKLQETEDQKTLSKTDITKAYNRGKMTKAAAIKRLDDMGYTLDDATIIIENEDVEDETDTRAEIIRAAEQKAKYLRLTKGQLTTVYTENGKSEAWAEARADYIEQLVLGKEETTEE